MSRDVSALERARLDYRPEVPPVLTEGLARLQGVDGQSTGSAGDEEAIRRRFPRTFGRPVTRLTAGGSSLEARPLTVGVVLSGGQAPGGHNVVTGLFDGLRSIDEGSRLHGFLDGPRGIIDGRSRELTAAVVGPYRNTGGFDMIGGGRDKIETEKQFEACRATCERMGLDGLVVVGGDDSNTNAALLAEYFVEHEVRTTVVGVPKTIDGDMRGNGIEASFGFDTATKIYSELVGNIARDAASARKYWHFIKLMGRNASHVALECALQTRPNVALIGEEVQQHGTTLDQIAEQVATVVRGRARAGRAYGVCIVPEGLIEFIPEMKRLIAELNSIVADDRPSPEEVGERLSEESRHAFDSLPQTIRRQLLLERDSHGNVQVSLIATEALLVEKVDARLRHWKERGEFDGSFRTQRHFFGYEGRSAAPSNFDANYTYALGRVATALVALGRTGYLCAVQGLAGPPAEWEALGIPITSLMQIERRKGRETPVIAKALVSTEAAPFLRFAEQRDRWADEDAYTYPGAIQYFGPPEVCRAPTMTLALESGVRP